MFEANSAPNNRDDGAEAKRGAENPFGDSFVLAELAEGGAHAAAGSRAGKARVSDIGLFDGDNPRPGHEATLEIIELGERLGFDSAWVRHRHLQYGISSPVAVLAAASQRTSRSIWTAVIPLGWENPLRLAEDLATVDILSGGRLNPGCQHRSAAALRRLRPALYPDSEEDFSYERVARLLRFVGGERAARLAEWKVSSSSPTGCSPARRGSVPHVVRRRQPVVGAAGRASTG